MLEHHQVLTWRSPNWALICLHDVERESVAAFADHFANAFVNENVARVYDVVAMNDVQKFDVDTILLKNLYLNV